MFQIAPSHHVDQVAKEAAKDIAYVTRYTFTKLSGNWLQPAGKLSIDFVCDFLFEESLAAILNRPEIERLYVQKLMLERKHQLLGIKKRGFSPKYVFSVGTPKFHKTKQCDCLTADFSNYRIPPEIEALGPQKITEFQEFCAQEKKRLEGKPDDVFWAQVSARFRVHINPEHVHYENSGVQDVSAMPISALQQQIYETVEASLDMQNGEEGSIVRKNRYARNTTKALACIRNPEQREIMKQFFTLKWKLIDMLFELYRKQTCAVDYVLPIHLLQASGIEPCRKCWR